MTLTEAIFRFQFINKILQSKQEKDLSNLYLSWYGINSYLSEREYYTAIEQRKNNLCSVDMEALSKQFLNRNSFASPSFENQVLKSQYLMLSAEMMLHALQLKAQSRQGKTLPNTLGDMPSRVCEANKWVYKSLPNGKWSISLDKQPVWLSRINLSPLTYTAR